MKSLKKIRPILQMEKTECGAASLAMILRYYGKEVTLEELRRECGVSRNGVNAKNIVKAAGLYNLKTRAFRADIEDLESLNMPLIIHWDMNHFLVLCGFEKNRAVLADPAYGIRSVPMDEFSRSFTGIAIELTPDENFRPDKAHKKQGGYAASCVKPFWKYAFYFALIELCALTGSAALLFLNSVYIDKVLIGANAQHFKILLGVLIVAGFITVSASVLREGVRYRISKRLNIIINSGFIRHILRLPIEFFAERSNGDLTNRYNSSMLMGERVTNLLTPVPGYIIQIAAYVLILILFDAHIAVIGILPALVNIAVIRACADSYRKKSGALSRDAGTLQGGVSAAVGAIETIKSSGSEDSMFERLIASGTKLLNTKIEIDKTDVLTDSLFSFINALTSGAVLIFGVWEILSGDVTVGVLIAMQSITAAMLVPVGEAINSEREAHSLLSETARSDDVMRCKTDDKFLDESVEQTADIDGDIEFKNVSFGYSAVDEPLIQNLNLKIKKGSRVAITGKSGSGKTTVANMIAGLYRETKGSVTFNGIERKDIARSYFYSKTAVVSQNIRLFDGNIIENITMWDDSVPYDDVVRAAKAACIHENIISRKHGYRERVTENGSNFSGGERQRIEIARALLKKPSLIIMDEATSALDADTEEKVMNNIKALGITAVIVAHRCSAISDCDEIIVMDRGKIAERGTHEKLLAKNGAYSALIRSVS